MPPLYALPPPNRVINGPNPPADMNAVVNVLNHSVYQRVFYMDQYSGADPTGATLSDNAWTSCYSDAAAAVQTHGGSLIVVGPGWYQFSVGVVSISDARIGLRCAGRQSTVFWTTGNSGTLVKITGTSGAVGGGSAPVTGFTTYGWNSGAAVNGLEYGDRYGGTLMDVASVGFNNGASRNYWFHNPTSLSEGSFISVMADQGTDDFVFQGSGTTGSFDWSHIVLKVTATTVGGTSGAIMKVINSTQMNGCYIQLSGGAQASSGLTKTGLVVGSSTSDTSVIQGSILNVMLEGDTSAGTLTDAVIQGAAGYGIDKCNGTMYFQNVTGTWGAGSVTSPAVFRMAGYINGPLFSSHGTLTALGTGGALSTYSG